MPVRLLTIAAAVCLLVGCNTEPAPPAAEASVVSAGPPPAVTVQEPSDKKSGDTREKFQQAWNQIRKKGGSAVEGASGLVDRIKQSGGEAGTNAMQWAEKKFQEARAAGETQATSATEWVQEDLKSAGTWEYKVVVTENSDPEKVQEALNQLGRERWECYSSTPDGRGLMLQLKRPNTSVIRSLPARDLIRLVPLLGLGGGGAE